MRIDVDMHAMEPPELWPRDWQWWQDTSVFLVEEYLKKLDEEKCNVGILHPTRMQFMNIPISEYWDWVQEFCRAANGRLVPSYPLSPYTSLIPEAKCFTIQGPQPPLFYKNDPRPLFVHTGANPTTPNLTIDHLLRHPFNAMETLTNMVFLGWFDANPDARVAFLESEKWWVDGFVSRMFKHIRHPFPPLPQPIEFYLGRCYFDDIDLGGSDFPHFDQKPLSLTKRQKEMAERIFNGTLA